MLNNNDAPASLGSTSHNARRERRTTQKHQAPIDDRRVYERLHGKFDPLASLRRDRQAWRVHGVLSLAALLSIAPASSATAPEPSELSADECRDRELDLFVGLGSPTAPKLLEIYIDPTEPNQLQIWLEARRIVGERGEELRLELIPSRGGRATVDPEADSVRMWFVTAAALGAAEEALRLLDGQDWQRVAGQVRTREGRAALAREIGVDPSDFEARRSGAAGACLARSFERMANELAVLTMGQPALVVGIVDRDGNRQISDVDTQLSELRTELDRVGIGPMFIDDMGMGFVPFGPTIGGRSPRLDRTFPSTGVLLGGEALPHRLVIFIEDEEHGRLPDWLEPAMRYRTKHPGELSVQVIAAGVGSRAIGLRRRLCAARTLGLEVEYLLHLADRPAVRRLHEEDLHAALDPVANSDACSDSEPLDPGPDGGGPDSRRGSDFGHPRGAWLDGRPVEPIDIENLEWQLDAGQTGSLIDWLMTPETFVGDSFEFVF